MSSKNIVKVGDQNFTIGEPSLKLYVRTLKFVAQLGIKGQTRATETAARVIYGAMKEGTRGADAAGLAPLIDGMSFYFILDELEEDDLVELAVLLLQSPNDETRELVRAEGIKLKWLSAALRLNVEAIGLDEVFANLLAIQKSLPRQQKSQT